MGSTTRRRYTLKETQKGGGRTSRKPNGRLIGGGGRRGILLHVATGWGETLNTKLDHETYREACMVWFQKGFSFPHSSGQEDSFCIYEPLCAFSLFFASAALCSRGAPLVPGQCERS